MGMKRPRSASANRNASLNITTDSLYDTASASFNPTIIPFPRPTSPSLKSSSRSRPGSASSMYSSYSRGTLDTQRSTMSLYSNRSFSSVNMPPTIGSIQAKRRIKERENVLPVHTCNTFFNNKRSSANAARCKRCSMIHNGKFANTSTHSVLASNLNGSITKINSRRISPNKTVDVQKEIECAEKLAAKREKYELEQKQIEHHKLTENIKTLIRYYSADVDENIQRIRSSAQLNRPKTPDSEHGSEIEDDVETNFYQKQARTDRIGRVSQDDLYDDNEILSLMEEYGVHCTPEVLEFSI